MNESGQRLRILHVDDDASQTYLMQSILKASLREPYELVTADSLTSAMIRLAGATFDVVLLDLGLPDSRGIETFDAVKAHAADSAIIVFTGQDDDEVAGRAVHEGAQDYLVKGEVDRRTIVRAIRHAIERKRIETALAQERDLLHSLIESLPDQVYVKDRSGRFIRANDAVARFFGLPDAEALRGKTDFDLFPHGLAQQFHDEEQRVIQSGRTLVNREVFVTSGDGIPRWELTTKVPFRDIAGRIVGTVGINRDVTAIKQAGEDLKRANAELERSQAELRRTVSELQRAHEDLRAAQLQLVEAEKMRTVGRLAAGVAHEVKNPLAIMLRGVDYLSKTPAAQDPTMAAVLRDMRGAIGRADGVIRSLLDYSAPQRIDATPQDLNRIIEESLSFVRHDLDERQVSVARDLDPALPPCPFDQQKLHEVFINLFENAAHAMPGGGTLTVRTSSRILAGVGANVGGNIDRFKVGDRIVIVEVADTGTGIPSDHLGRVFDPFFTTKPTGQGTGLGLSVCKTIMDLHGGTIELRNRPEGGAVCTLVFQVSA